MFFSFPLTDLINDDDCYLWLMRKRWPEGKPICPRCGEKEQIRIHDRKKAPIEDWRCKSCGRIFNIFTGTIFQKNKRSCSHIVLILQGFCQGKTTSLLARELECDEDTLLKLRHKWNAACAQQCFEVPGFGALDTVEIDEMYQNAGEKRNSPPRSKRSSSKKS